MDASPNATEHLRLFFVVDSSNTTVVSDSIPPSDTTSVTLPAVTLLPGQTYTFEVLFSDRITGSDDVGGSYNAVLRHPYDGSFSTAAGAVPEPSTWAMLLMGFVGLGFAGFYADGSKARRRSAG